MDKEAVGKYRKKPVVIEAMQLPSDAAGFWKVYNWIREDVAEWDDQPFRIRIRTLEGEMWATEGDWIIKGVQGEFYPCKPDIFAATYEPADALAQQAAAQAVGLTDGEITAICEANGLGPNLGLIVGRAIEREVLSRAAPSGEPVAWQVRSADGRAYSDWEACTRDLYEATRRTGRYAGFENGPSAEVRALYAAPQPTGPVVAWVRFCSDGGVEGPIMDWDRRMDDARRESGAWTPLGVLAAPQPSAQQAAQPAEEARSVAQRYPEQSAMAKLTAEMRGVINDALGRGQTLLSVSVTDLDDLVSALELAAPAAAPLNESVGMAVEFGGDGVTGALFDRSKVPAGTELYIRLQTEPAAAEARDKP